MLHWYTVLRLAENFDQPNRMLYRSSVTRLGDLLHFGVFSKPVATIILAKLPTFFCKVVEIFHFASESFEPSSTLMEMYSNTNT